MNRLYAPGSSFEWRPVGDGSRQAALGWLLRHRHDLRQMIVDYAPEDAEEPGKVRIWADLLDGRRLTLDVPPQGYTGRPPRAYIAHWLGMKHSLRGVPLEWFGERTQVRYGLF